MKNTRTLLCILMGVCVGVVVSGCSGEKEMAVTQQDVSSSVAPQEEIFRAAGTGDVARLKSLVGADAALVKARGMNKMTPLHAAAADGQDAAVTYLLEQGANPKAVDENSSTPVDAALGGGHKGTAKLLNDWIAKSGGGAAQ